MSYPPPVDGLLTYGDCHDYHEWPDYPKELDLGSEHIPDLIRMATDDELHWTDEDSFEVWAPIHAWRALGQLRAEEAIEPLLFLLDEDNDWALEELPTVYGMIGPAAIPALQAYLAKNAHEDGASISITGCLEKVANEHPEARDACVTALVSQLKRFTRNGPALNGFIVSTLVHLKATEAVPVIERAFATDRVDESIMGDWEDVQIQMGLKEPDEEWLKREQYMEAAMEALREGKSLPFSIHQHVFWNGESSEAQADRYREQLVTLLEESPEGQTLVKEGIQPQWADMMIQFGIDYQKVTPPKMSPANLREILFELIPRKVIAQPEEASKVIQELRAFWTFVGREFGLRNASSCLKVMDDRARRKLEKAMGNPEHFGIGKSLITMGAERGFDMSTPEGIQTWVDTYNAEIAAGSGLPVPLPGERSQSARKSRNKRKRKMQKDSRRKNRNKR